MLPRNPTAMMTRGDQSADLDRECLLPDVEHTDSLFSGKDYEGHAPTSKVFDYWRRHRRALWTRIYMLVVHVALITAIIILWVQNTSGANSSRQGSYSPPFEAIRTEVHDNRILEYSSDHIYAGPPSPAHNKAWDALIYATYLNMSEEQLIEAGESIEDSVQLESGGYVAATGVYHELHCIRRLRFYVYKDIYYPNMTQEQEEAMRPHLDHCLEVLREEVMCTGDVSILTFFWHDPPKPKPGSKTNSKRSCINWNRFEQWSLQHMVPTDAAVKGGPRPMWSKELGSPSVNVR